MKNNLTIDILDEAIAKIKELKNDTCREIHLNPDDWRKAKTAMKVLCGLCNISYMPGDYCFGIPVITLPELPEGTMLLVYDKDHCVKVEHVGGEEMTCTICNQLPCTCGEVNRSMTLLQIAGDRRDIAEARLDTTKNLVKQEAKKHSDKCFAKKVNWRYRLVWIIPIAIIVIGIVFLIVVLR